MFRKLRGTTAAVVLASSMVFCASPPVSAAAESVVAPTDLGVLGWGANTSYQVGDETTVQRQVPTPVVAPNEEFVQVAAGDHTLGLKADGTVWSWGSPLYGALGRGVVNDGQVPTQIRTINGITQVATGFGLSVALKGDGTVFTWGFDLSAGAGNTGNPDPGVVPQLHDVVKIAAAGTHAMAIERDGTLWDWGINVTGVLGTGDTDDRGAPQRVGFLPPVRDVATGPGHTVAIGQNGNTYVWGSNANGQLGIGIGGPGHTMLTTPNELAAVTGALEVHAGAAHTVVLMADHTVQAWGDNTHGQLGDGTLTARDVPQPVPGLTGVQTLATGAEHNLAMLANHTAVGWGANSDGQLGDDSTADRSRPVPVVGLTGVTSIGAGGRNSAATVHRPADFAVQVTPNKRSIVAGQSTTATVNVTESPGYAGVPVQLGVAGLQPDVHTSFTPSSISGTATSTLTIDVPLTSLNGTYTVRVIGTIGSMQRVASYDLVISGVVVNGCHASNGTDLPIPDSAAVVTSAVDSSGCVFVQAPTSVLVEVHILHPHAGDLALSLLTPDGRVFPLKASDPADASVNLNRTYRVDLVNPSGFAAGTNANQSNIWRLRMQDAIPGNAGRLDSWTLHM